MFLFVKGDQTTEQYSKLDLRLQRMLLRVQKYSLDVTYLRGEKILVSDNLSRAYLPEVSSCIFVRELEEVDYL